MGHPLVLTCVLLLAFAGMGWAAHVLARLVVRTPTPPRARSTRFTDRARLRPFPYLRALGWAALFGAASTCFWAAVAGLRDSLSPEAIRVIVWSPAVAIALLLLVPPLLQLRGAGDGQPSMVWSSLSVLLAFVLPPLLVFVGALTFLVAAANALGAVGL